MAAPPRPRWVVWATSPGGGVVEASHRRTVPPPSAPPRYPSTTQAAARRDRVRTRARSRVCRPPWTNVLILETLVSLVARRHKNRDIRTPRALPLPRPRSRGLRRSRTDLRHARRAGGAPPCAAPVDGAAHGGAPPARLAWRRSVRERRSPRDRGRGSGRARGVLMSRFL